MFIPRKITKQIKKDLLQSDKILIIYGARQVGKTTLVNKLIEEVDFKTLKINADEYKYNEILESRDLNKLKSLVQGYELLFIDEAQRIQNIGINLKLLKDNLPNLKIIVTGSSSFDLANKISEPLTGRKWTYKLYPISFLELSDIYNDFELEELLEERLIWGSYPEIFSIQGYEQKERYLSELTNSYLYKDILDLAEVKSSNVIRDLLKLLAFQVGSEVSLSELATNLSISVKTVGKYLDLLQKSFVIFELSGFSRNLRKEVTKSSKYYFYDLGVRNILIDNMKNLRDRNDKGALWENFLVIERIKRNFYLREKASSYFWRLYTGAAIDYVEDRETNLYGYEFKFSSDKARSPVAWQEEYENSTWELINKNNFVPFLTK